VWISLCIPLSLLGNNLVKTFPQQRIIVRAVVLYAVRAVSEESGLLVLPRTCCSFMQHALYRRGYLIFSPFKQMPEEYADDNSLLAAES
jgi:hypothetical protein